MTKSPLWRGWGVQQGRGWEMSVGMGWAPECMGEIEVPGLFLDGRKTPEQTSQSFHPQELRGVERDKKP